MTNTSISSLMIMVLAGTATFMGMFTVMEDMNTSGYNISLPDTMEDDFDSLSESMNATATDIEGTLTGDQGWLETAYSIVFRLPQSITSTLSTMSDAGSSLYGAATGPDMANVAVPPWVTTTILTFIAIIVAVTLFYVIMGRKP